MQTYISLTKWSHDGITNVKGSPDRLKKARAAMEAAGGKLKAFYMTMGEYDMVVISEFPDSVSAAKALLAIGQTGMIVTNTLQAFAEAEYKDIIKSLP